MTTTSDFNKSIQYYLDRLQNGPCNVKKIESMINQRFNVSGVAVRNKLIKEGAIELKIDGYDKKRMRNNFIVSLVNANKAKFVEETKPIEIKSIVVQTHWPEGWPRSNGNAFDWRNYAKGLFSKQEMAAMRSNLKAQTAFNPPITTYTKA